MGFTITSVTAGADDILTVTAINEDGNEVTALGHASATSAFYDPSDVDNDRMPVEGATTRAMTPDEVGAYAMALLEGRDYFAEVYPHTVEAAAPVEIAFTPPS